MYRNEDYVVKYSDDYGHYHVASSDFQEHWLSTAAVAELLGISSNSFTSRLSALMGLEKPDPMALPKGLKIQVLTTEKTAPAPNTKTKYWSLVQVNKILKAWMVRENTRKSVEEYLVKANYFAVYLEGLVLKNDDVMMFLEPGFYQEDEQEQVSSSPSSLPSSAAKSSESDHAEGFYVSTGAQYSSSSSVASPEKGTLVQQVTQVDPVSEQKKPPVQRKLVDFLAEAAKKKTLGLRAGLNAALSRKAAEA